MLTVSNRSAPLPDLNASIESPLSEPEGTIPTSKSTARRVHALELIVKRQRAKLDLLDNALVDTQGLLSGDKSLFERSRRLLATQKTGGSNRSDDLRLIKGISWRKAARLRNLGIQSFGDIARLNEEDILWLDQVMGLQGSIEREDWVRQSRALSLREARRKRLARQTKGLRNDRPTSGEAQGHR